MITWSRFAGMKFCPALPGSRQYSKLFINFILWLHGKSFIPARQDPAFVLPGSRFAGTKFSHEIASVRLSATKNLIKKLSIEVHFNRSKIFLLCFYEVYDVSLWEKINKCLISLFYRSSHRRCSAKKVFLKILQYSQEKTWVSLQVFRFVILLGRDTNT